MMVPARSVSVPTTPGRQVQFRQGLAIVNDTRDLSVLLRRADVKIEMSEYAMSWMDEVLRDAGEVKAQVHWPEKPTVEAEADPIDQAIKDKPRWQKPPSNSSAS